MNKIIHKQPLKICIATVEIVGPHRNGGIGTAYTAMAEVLVKAGHQISILYLGAPRCEEKDLSYWIEHYAKSGIELICFPPSPPHEKTVNFYHQQKSYEILQWFLKQASDFDIVHFHEWSGYGYYTLLAKHQGWAFQQTLFCIGTHGPTLWCKSGNHEFIHRTTDLEIDFMEQESVRLADIVISPSQYLLNWMEEKNWHFPKQTFVQPNLFPSAAVQEESQSNQKHNEISEIVFFGRCEPRKGVEIFCDAMDKINHKIKNITQITFLGKNTISPDFNSSSYIKKRAKNWKVGYQILSDYNREEALNYLKQAGKIAIIPSFIENSPYTVMECIYYKIAFMASAVGGIPELIHQDDDEKVCFEPNGSSLAEKLEHSLKYGLQPVRSAVDFLDNQKKWIDFHEKIHPTVNRHTTSNETPLVSVCISHFNRPLLLRQLLDSLDHQTYQNFEVIIVDDGSHQDDAKNFLATLELEFQQLKPHWKIIYQKNAYLGAARNTAAKNAKGQYLLFMDDDNVAMPGQISTFVQIALQTNADILTCGLQFFEGINPPSNKDNSFKKYWLPLGKSLSVGFFKNCFGDANFLIKKSAFISLDGFTEDYGVGYEDWEFLAKAALQGLTLEVIPKPLFYYRVQKDSMTRRGNLYKCYQRSFRPYLETFPAEIHNILLCAQGAIFYDSNRFSTTPSSSSVDLYWDSWSWWITRPLRAIVAKWKKQPRLKRPIPQNADQERAIIDEIIQSRSWKITKPLRYIKNKLFA